MVRAFAPFDSTKTCSTYSTGQVYAYNPNGQMTGYEGATNTFNTTGPDNAVKNSCFTYDANGNLTAKPGLSLSWDYENRLASAGSESYLYDDANIRVRKSVGSTHTYYPFRNYEVTGSTDLPHSTRVSPRQGEEGG